MGLFKKKRDEIIDFSDMYKRGWIKAENNENEHSDVIDLTKQQSSPSSSKSQPSGDMDFLSGFAQASVDNSSLNSQPSWNSGSVTDSLRAARRETGDHLRTEVNELRIKLDDANYKIETLMEKIRELERRLG